MSTIDIASDYAQAIAAKFTKRYQDEAAKSGHTAPDVSVHLEVGQRYIRLVQENGSSYPHVHAFIERETAKLIKAAGWKAPAKDKNGPAYRYDLSTPEGFLKAVLNADPYGAYLYADFKQEEI